MKIVLFGLNGRGGMMHYTSQFANALTKYAEVYVVLPSYTRPFLFDKKVNLIRLNASPSIRGTALGTINIIQHKNLVKLINSINPDVIHFMDNHPWYVYYCNKFKSKVYVTQHDPKLHSGEQFSLLGLVSAYVNKVLRNRADKIIVHGDSLKDYLTHIRLPTSKIKVIPMGNFDFFTKWSKPTRKEKMTILFFGRIVKYKGLDILLRAIHVVKTQMPNIKLIIAGEGDIKPYEHLMKGIEKNLEIHNEYVEDYQVAQLFQRSKLVVLPYLDATQSAIAPIAYSFKVPVIATAVGSIPEEVDDTTGMLIAPNNVEMLADAIFYMINRNDLDKLGENGYNRMKKMMDWDKIVKEVYQ